jgi:hypothetical protein
VNLWFLLFDEFDVFQGWSVVVTVIFEIPLMYRAPQLLKRFETGTLIIAAELAYSLRTLVYTLMGTNTWILLFVEPCVLGQPNDECFHANAFAAYMVSRTLFSQRAPPSTLRRLSPLVGHSLAAVV